MRKLASFVVLLSVSSVAAAEVSVRVCLADGNTPLEPADANTPFVYRDIMVGTRLTIIVASDATGTWSGGLYVEGIDRNSGILSGRGCNAKTRDCGGSHLPAAGLTASVCSKEDFLTAGFDLNSQNTAVPGDWFIIDYTATQVGSSRVGFYDYSIFENMFDPVRELFFSHVPTRDIDQDGTVGFGDFAVFASYWGAANCVEPDRCQGADLDADGDVDSADLALFADYWLEKTG